MPAPLVASRRLLALDAKLDILTQESRAWQRDSANAETQFALHHSQIDEVCQDLDAIRALISTELTALRASAAPAWADIERLEQIGRAHV